MSTLGVIINPMSGRDVRRLAARAGTSTHTDKQNQLARIVVAAAANGITQVVLTRDPFRIAEHAVENLPCRQIVTIVDIPITHTDADTRAAVKVMQDHNCGCVITFGGDGTNRIVAGAWPDAVILPLSTGTNNVFPAMLEPTVAGAACALIACGVVKTEAVAQRAKQIHIYQGDRHELALVDAVLLKDDILGSLLPFAAADLAEVYLTRAEPAAVGMSPIGGFILPCGISDDFGVKLICGDPAQFSPHVPVSPGLYATVSVRSAEQLPFELSVTVSNTGILAFDGDRTLAVSEQNPARLVVRRDGPWIVDTALTMQTAARAGALSRQSS